eukprot:5562590-Prorocentrum_lima.AAC.1
MTSSLVGSEMCIRDRSKSECRAAPEERGRNRWCTPEGRRYRLATEPPGPMPRQLGSCRACPRR